MDKLTKKQRIFVKEYIKDENGTQSALKAYDTKSENVANVIAVENLRKPMIVEVLKNLAERIPDELLEKVHLEGLNAGKRVFKNNNETGEIEDLGVEPDYAIRHKYLDSGYKLKGSYAAEKNINLNVNIESVDPTDPEVLNAMKIIQEKLENGTKT